jgi:hypothetical protein
MGAFCTVSYGVGGVFYRLVSSSNSQVSYQLIWKLTLLLLCLLSTATTSTTAKKECRFDVNISYTIDGVIHGVVSGRPFDRFLLNQVDVDPHIYNLLFKSCRIVPQCLRNTKSQQSTRRLFYIILLFTSVRLQICPQ